MSAWYNGTSFIRSAIPHMFPMDIRFILQNCDIYKQVYKGTIQFCTLKKCTLIIGMKKDLKKVCHASYLAYTVILIKHFIKIHH